MYGGHHLKTEVRPLARGGGGCALRYGRELLFPPPLPLLCAMSIRHGFGKEGGAGASGLHCGDGYASQPTGEVGVAFDSILILRAA